MANHRKNLVKIISILIIFIFSITTFVKADQNEIISRWALEEIEMAAFYNIIDKELINESKKPATVDLLLSTVKAIYDKMESEENRQTILNVYELAGISQSMDLSLPVTRKDVLFAFSSLMLKMNIQIKSTPTKEIIEMLRKEGISTEAQKTIQILSFFLSNDILKGRSSNNLALNSYCTVEELFAIAKRVYEQIKYETNDYSKCLFWEVSDDNNSVYVLGSIHYADERIYPLNKDVIKSYEKADYLVVEANVNTDYTGLQYLQQKMMSDKNLSELVSSETYKIVMEELSSVGPEGIPAENMKPWGLAMTIESLKMQRAIKGSINKGIDNYFFLKAMISNKPILELEGLKFQVDLFDSLPLNIQDYYLRSATILTYKQAEDIMNFYFKCIKEGDDKNLYAALNANNRDALAKEFNKLVITNRNSGMVSKIESYLADKENKIYFVVAGAAHMVGEDGVINLLVKKGYKIKRIK